MSEAPNPNPATATTANPTSDLKKAETGSASLKEIITASGQKITPEQDKRNFMRVLVAYWLLGLTNNFGYVVMLTAAYDLLESGESSSANKPKNSRECNYLSTGTILIADIAPCLVVKIFSPFFPFLVHIRMLIMVTLYFCSYILVAFYQELGYAGVFTGVVFVALCSGLGEATLLQYMAYYHRSCVSTWASGTGGAGVLGSFSYAILASLGIKKSMLLMLVSPVITAVAFWVILPSPDLTPVTAANVQMQAQLNQEELKMARDIFRKKLKIMPKLIKYMIPIGLVYLFEYTINQGMYELIVFEDIFIDHQAQYRWYQVCYQIGVFISRSSVNFVQFKKIWIMSVLQFINVMIFLAETLMFFIPSIWVVWGLIIWEGLVGGAAYVNTFYKITQEVEETEKQFSMSMTSTGDATGITLAGFLSIPVHNWICATKKPTRRWKW